jgi:rod shape-determining protein MreC
MSPRRRLDRHTRSQLIAFGSLLAISVLLMGVSRTGLARRIQNVFNFVMNPIVTVVDGATDTAISMWTAVGEIDRIRQDNDALRRENETLRQQLQRMPSVSRLLDDWTKITQAQQSIQYQSTRARVLARALADVGPRIFIIDKGSNDGIRVGQVVVGEGAALVGRVTAVEDRVCTVTLLVDLTSIVIGREESTGAIGTVQGQPGGLLRMTFTPESPRVEVGQVIVTAGEAIVGSDIRSPYPPALLIGTLSTVAPDASASSIVTPAADLYSTVFVLIITNYEGGIPVPEGSPSASPTPGATPTLKPSPTAQ